MTEQSQADYYDTAADTLPGAGLGAYALADDVRFIIKRGKGSKLEDMDGNTYIDYVCGAGAMILGNAHPAVVAAAQSRMADGFHFFGTLNNACVELARELVDAIPCAEHVAFSTTGGEATFYAMRMARAFTGRNKVLKFEGGYHGSHDYSQIAITPKALSNYPSGQPETGGIPDVLPSTVLVAPYNDLEAVRTLVEENRDDLACVMVEPVQRIIWPDPGFLEGLRKICDDNGVLLAFDEVVTGFRLAYGGAQEKFGVIPDLAAFGKVVGGGAHLGAVGGRADIIDLANPANKAEPTYAQVNGTLHGNPLASVVGQATLAELKKPDFYSALDAKGDALRAELQAVLERRGMEAVCCGGGSFWQILFLNRVPRNYADMLDVDNARNKALDEALIKEGIYVLPNVRRFVSAAHTDDDIEATAKALDAACRRIG